MKKIHYYCELFTSLLSGAAALHEVVVFVRGVRLVPLEGADRAGLRHELHDLADDGQRSEIRLVLHDRPQLHFLPEVLAHVGGRARALLAAGLRSEVNNFE